MVINQHQIFVSDLDGTLLRNDGKLSDYSRDKLNELLDAGVHFTVASARAWSEITPVLGDLPLTLPVIAVNGAYITDYASGEHLVINALEDAFARQIYQHILDHGLEPFVVAHDGERDRLYWQELRSPQMQWYHDILILEGDVRLSQIDALETSLDQTVIAFAVMGDEKPIKRLSALLDQRYPGRMENFLFQNPYSPGHWWLTIHDEKTCKSKGIRKVVEMTGHDFKNLTVFGDHNNDIKMFQLAGTAVAVANAEPQTKEAADIVIDANEDDAVVNYIMNETSR